MGKYLLPLGTEGEFDLIIECSPSALELNETENSYPKVQIQKRVNGELVSESLTGWPASALLHTIKVAKKHGNEKFISDKYSIYWPGKRTLKYDKAKIILSFLGDYEKLFDRVQGKGTRWLGNTELHDYEEPSVTIMPTETIHRYQTPSKNNDSIENSETKNDRSQIEEIPIEEQSNLPETFNFDQELRKKYDELFGDNKESSQEKCRSSLQKIAEEIRAKHFMEEFEKLNSYSSEAVNDVDDESIDDKLDDISNDNKSDDESINDESDNHEFSKEKHFTITDIANHKTVVYEVYKCISYEKLLSYFDAIPVRYTEEINKDETISRTFFVDDCQIEGNQLIILTFCDDCVFVNNGLLINNEVRLSKNPQPFIMNTTTESELMACLHNGTYDLESFGNNQNSNNPVEYIEDEADVNYPVPIIIDPRTAEPVKRELYYDDEKKEQRAKIRLKKSASYFSMELAGSRPLTDVEIGVYYSHGKGGFPEDVPKALSYLEKDGSANALLEIAHVFLMKMEYYDKETGLEYLQKAADAGCEEAITELEWFQSDNDRWDIAINILKYLKKTY